MNQNWNVCDKKFDFSQERVQVKNVGIDEGSIVNLNFSKVESSVGKKTNLKIFLREMWTYTKIFCVKIWKYNTENN